MGVGNDFHRYRLAWKRYQASVNSATEALTATKRENSKPGGDVQKHAAQLRFAIEQFQTRLAKAFQSFDQETQELLP